jgi:hypothetical protein
MRVGGPAFHDRQPHSLNERQRALVTAMLTDVALAHTASSVRGFEGASRNEQLAVRWGVRALCRRSDGVSLRGACATRKLKIGGTGSTVIVSR